MNIQTKYLGEVTIDDEMIIHFPGGIPGFLEQSEFVLLDIPGNSVFQFLQSVNTVPLAFVVTNPYHFYQDYSFELDEGTLESLQIKSVNDVLIVNIVTLKDPFETSTINLKAPLVINQKKMLGKQYILNTDVYPSKASIKPTVGKGV